MPFPWIAHFQPHYAPDLQTLQETDFSVVLFRPNFMLVSEGHLVKAHKNQWLLNPLLSLISLGEPQTKAYLMVPEVQTPSQ